MAFDRQRMHVRRARRGHHHPLHVGDPAVRKQHDKVDIVQVGEGFDRGAAGVAGSRHHDGGALLALFQHVIHQPRQQLHRDVLERQRRPMEQLEHELARAGLPQRHHRRMPEGGVGVARHPAELGVGDLAGDERPDHLDGDLPVRPAEQAGDGIGSELRPDFRNIQSAVTGEPGQHHVAKAEARGFAPGRNIGRQGCLQRPGPTPKPLILIEFSLTRG